MNGNRTLIIGGGVIVALAVGWFFMSYLVMGTAAVDAVGEALGVGFGLLVLASVIGAFTTSRERRD